MKKNIKILITVILALGIAFSTTGCFTVMAIVKRTSDAVSEASSTFDTDGFHFHWGNVDSYDDLFNDDDHSERDADDDSGDNGFNYDYNYNYNYDYDELEDLLEEMFGFNPVNPFFDIDVDYDKNTPETPETTETTDVGRRDDFGKK